MSTLVLNSASLVVKLESEHIVVHDHADDSFRRVPLFDVERVVVVGQPAISFPVFAKLLDMGIPCSFLTHGGRWRGVMDGDGGFHAQRRMAQYKCAGDDGFMLRLSRELVAAKIANCRRTIQRFAAERRMPISEDLDWRRLSSVSAGLVLAGSSNEARGVEGVAANIYFSLLARFFPEDAPFERRSRRPPRNPANALLSFAYTLLSGIFVSCVRAHGLDVACGFFHRPSGRSPALALDLMEPFRSPWCDRFVLNLLNHRRIRANAHFDMTDEDGVMLNRQGRAVVFRAFDEMMAGRQDTDAGRLSRRQIVDREICKFIGAIESGDGSGMSFYRAV